MAPESTPESLRRADFRTVFRGLDPTEVKAALDDAAAAIEELQSSRDKLEKQLQESSGADLSAEFENVGREVSSILQSAREAAEAMRERASLDATRWRTEATEEAENLRKVAAADAEALRRDAWVTSSDMLEQVIAESEKARATAERDVLTTMGAAEREAHRLTSGARREAEDLVRNATMDAEKILNDATTRRDEIIDGANRQAATAQERTRALEQRRDELLVELENVRSTLTRLEGSLEERREALDLSASGESTSVKVVHPPADAPNTWDVGETVRVVRPDSSPTSEPDPGLAEELSRDVAALSEPTDPGSEPSVSPPEQEEVVAEGDDVEALFAALRQVPEPSADPEVDPTDAEVGDDDDEPSEVDAADNGGVEVDWIEIREARLLPITNRALRGVKKSMTDMQNIALDNLRTSDDWSPNPSDLAEALHAEVVAVWSESFAAGHQVAEEMTGDKVKRPRTPATKADQALANDLASAVSSALAEAGDEARDRQSAASKVFRVWRSDEAERRLRELAIEAYEAALERSGAIERA